MDDVVVLDVSLTDAAGAREAEAFFAEFLADGLVPSADGRVPLRLVHAAQGRTHQFANVGGTEDTLLLHVVSLSSVRDLAASAGLATVDPLRFRANLLIDGLEPWVENSWVGQRVRCGDCVLEITEPTIRCPATMVEPSGATVGERNLNPPELLQQLYPNAMSRSRGDLRPMAIGGPEAKGGYLGVYAEVVQGGEIRIGDGVRVIETTGPRYPTTDLW
jgi:uncharacterized protein YcbX